MGLFVQQFEALVCVMFGGVRANQTRRDDEELLGQERCQRDEVKQTTSPAEHTMSCPSGSEIMVMMMNYEGGLSEVVMILFRCCIRFH